MQSKPSPAPNDLAHLTMLDMRRTEVDPNHHLSGPFLPQTPLSAQNPALRSPAPGLTPVSPWLRWAVEPFSSLQLLSLPIVLYINWELVSPYVQPGVPNPFGAAFLLSGFVPTSSPGNPTYAKSYADLLFIAYHIVFFSLIRTLVTDKACSRIAKYFGLKRESKIVRFGEQGYALVYFMVFGAWGFHIMGQLPTWWYRTEYFWIDYPHWQMKPQLKRYYLMQSAYWCQQLLILVLKLEKPRKDYAELVAHHIVTLWLVGWSYLFNLTLIGNAVFMSMDIPDTFLAISKLSNYIQWERTTAFALSVFILIWTYFRHYLNFRILWSVWYEYDLIPETSKRWEAANGTYLVSWVRYQVFVPLVLLQLLNLFWYYLILRIIVRAVIVKDITDVRSDDEDEKVDMKED